MALDELSLLFFLYFFEEMGTLERKLARHKFGILETHLVLSINQKIRFGSFSHWQLVMAQTCPLG